MKKTFLIVCFCWLGMILVFAACDNIDVEDFSDANQTSDESESLPEIGWTRIDADFFEGSDESAILSLAEVPFKISIPSSWGWTEDPEEYILWIDQGSVGSIAISKNSEQKSTEDFADGSWQVYEGESRYVKTICQNDMCFVRFDSMENESEFYSLIISDKSFSAKQRGEITMIIESIDLD